MTALADPATFQLHDLEDRDVRDDPAWRDLLGDDLSAKSSKHPGHPDQSVHGRRRRKPVLDPPDAAKPPVADGPKPKPRPGPRAGSRRRDRDQPRSHRAVGKDLIASDASETATEADRKAVGRSYASAIAAGHREGPSGDEQLAAIAEMQGFDGKPEVVSMSEMDRLIAEGHVELHRGVRRAQDQETGRTVSADELKERFRHGSLYHGAFGSMGNGTYVSEDLGRARLYGEGAPLRMALRKDARVVDGDSFFQEHADFLRSLKKDSVEWFVYSDPGRYAAARGIDAVKHQEEAGITDYLLINRTAVIVQEA